MSEYELLKRLLEDVRRLYRTEAEPEQQAKAYDTLRQTMYVVMDAVDAIEGEGETDTSQQTQA